MAGRENLSGQQWRKLALGAALVVILLVWFGVRNWNPLRSSFAQQGIEASAATGKIVWPKVKADGADFAYLLATWGDAGIDEAFAEHWQEAAAAGMKRGAIHRYDLCRLARDQATNFIAHVPRIADELPVAVDLDLDQKCQRIPSRPVVLQEVAAFIKAVEAHSEKPVILKVSRDFENEFAVSRAINRPLWLSSFFLTPSYGERPWIMWRANGSRSVDGIGPAVSWSVVRQ